MTEGDLTTQQIMRLRDLYQAGGLTPEQRRDFEIEFPHLLPKRVSKVDPWISMAGGGPMGGRPFLEDPIENKAVQESLMQSEMATLKTIAPMALSAAGGTGGLVGGTALAARLAPYLGRFGSALLPAAGEAVGSETARRLNVVAGTEEEGMGGDIAAMAPSALRLLRPLKQLFVRSLPEAKRAILAGQPRAGESTREMLLAGKGQQTPFERGSVVQEAALENKKEIKALLQPRIDTMKKNIGNVDLTDLEAAAQAKGMSLRISEEGAEIFRFQDIAGDQRAITSFDNAWEVLTDLGGRAQAAKALGDDDKSRLLWQFYHRLNKQLDDAAQQAGHLGEWKAVRNEYGEEVIGRFKNKLFEKVTSQIRRTGEGMVFEMSGEDVAGQGFRMSAQEAKTFANMLGKFGSRHGVPPTAAHEAFRTGMLASALEDSVDQATGLFNARKFFNLFSHMPEEAREALLGKELADSVLDFGKKTLQGVRRISFGIGAGGALTTGVIAGGRMGPVAAAETANEFTMIANRIARSPKIMRAITRAVLSSPTDRLTRITATDVLRLAGESARPALFAAPEDRE